MTTYAMRCAVMGLLFLAASAQAQIVIPIPPYTVYGKAYTWDGRPFSTNDAATVIAYANGTEVGRCDTVSGLFPSLNYRISIPLANGRMIGRAQMGDVLTFKILFDSQMHSVCTMTVTQTVGASASTVRIDLVVGTDSAHDGLPDEFKYLLLPYYQAYGRGDVLADVRAGDDFDGDGYSNLQEYYAGTSPVDATDFPRILKYAQANGGYQAISFLAAPRRSYILPRLDNLASNNWRTTEFVMSTNEVSPRSFYSSDLDNYTTLYTLPTNSFGTFRLEIK